MCACWLLFGEIHGRWLLKGKGGCWHPPAHIGLLQALRCTTLVYYTRAPVYYKTAAQWFVRGWSGISQQSGQDPLRSRAAGLQGLLRME